MVSDDTLRLVSDLVNRESHLLCLNFEMGVAFAWVTIGFIMAVVVELEGTNLVSGFEISPSKSAEKS